MQLENRRNVNPPVYYKIVEKKNSNLYTLFHGIGGTRKLPIDTWIEGEIRENVMDGHGTKYTSGIHIIEGKENAEEYLKRFKRTDRVIVECHAEGLRRKEKSKSYVYLANRIKIIN